MGKRKDYIPYGDDALFDFAKNISLYGSLKCSKWFVLNPESMLTPLLDDFEAKLIKSKETNSGDVDKKAKNVAKEKLIKALRSYIQGFVARNPNVTDEDKTAMHLPIYDREPTVVLEPTGQPKANIELTRPAQLMVQIIHDEADQQDKRTNYGCRIYFGVYAAGDTVPASGKELRESIFTRRKKELFNFQPEDSGKTAYFSIRYENSKGKAGPWGPMTKAMIP